MSLGNCEQSPGGALSAIVENRKIVICAGAGGVGKTTVSAAIALRAARSGRRVACLTIDPAKRLADSLGVDLDRGDGELKDISFLLGGSARAGGSLRIGMLNPGDTFDAFVRKKASSPETARRILASRLYKYVSGSLSGMQEYMALEKLYEIRCDETVDLIVLDTPPSANAMDFFTAPRRMVEALDGTLVRLMRGAYGATGSGGVGIMLGKWAGTVFRALSGLTGVELMEEVIAFVDALSDLFGSLTSRAKLVEDVLHRDEVCLCLVSSAQRATLRETRNLRHSLKQIGLRVEVIVFNRVHWPRIQVPDGKIAAAGKAAGEAGEIATGWNEENRVECKLIDSVRDAWKGLELVVTVPLIPGDVGRLDGLNTIGKYL